MTRPLTVLRPQPGNAATVGRIAAAGLTATALPLFAARPVAWTVPDPAAYDALVLTSANAARLAGPGLAALARLPVLAVGAATAAAARTQGLQVALVGTAGADALIAGAAAKGFARVLHLAGRDRMPAAPGGGIVHDAITVYASDALAVPEAAVRTIADSVALVHSARAGGRLAELVDAAGLTRDRLAIAAIGDAVAAAAGPGWRAVAVAARPDDAALIAAARALAD